MLDLFDPEVEWVPPAIAPGMAPSYGREELRAFWLDWLSDWQVHRFEPEEITESGDRVLALLRNRLRGRDGIEFEAGVGVIFTFRGEKIVRGAVYLDQDSARQEFEAGA
jgi:ketosteroid isomerase-like protein